ncbi:MAG: sigma-E factor negative regulatory protein RseB [Kiritimatiellia bacterium]|jgi:sigma-E factor negative regulatory protein RseB
MFIRPAITQLLHPLNNYVLPLLFLLGFSLLVAAETEENDSVDSDVAFFSTSMGSSPSIENLLSHVVNASRYYSYQGLLTYEANGSLTTLSLYQRIDDEVENARVYQRLAFLDGASRRVIREQNLTACMSGKTRWGLWPNDFNADELKRFYDISIQAEERVANRATFVISLVAKDQFRYGYRFNIDKQTGLLLRSVIVENEGIVERTQFVTIDLNMPSGERLLKNQEAISWRVPEVEPCHTEQFQSAWFVSWLPEGFSPVGNRVTAQGEQVLMFSDGLVSISVFITSSQYKDIPKITARRGATIAVMTPLTFDSSKTVAVVGEVPIVTARRMAVSVKSK